MKLFLTIVILLVSIYSFALQIVYTNYIVEYDPLSHTTFYTRYEYNKQKANYALQCSNSRQSHFYKDKKVFNAVSSDNYKFTKYDRGHLVPAADFPYDKETFSTINIMPQSIKLNRGRWKSIELEVRKLCTTKDNVVIYTGVLVFNYYKYIGKDRIPIPDYFYKVVITESEIITYLEENK